MRGVAVLVDQLVPARSILSTSQVLGIPPAYPTSVGLCASPPPRHEQPACWPQGGSGSSPLCSVTPNQPRNGSDAFHRFLRDLQCATNLKEAVPKLSDDARFRAPPSPHSDSYEVSKVCQDLREDPRPAPNRDNIRRTVVPTLQPP